jgi:hypothetical protein
LSARIDPLGLISLAEIVLAHVERQMAVCTTTLPEPRDWPPYTPAEIRAIDEYFRRVLAAARCWNERYGP